MTGWNALPTEIHHHILRLFCEDIIDKYARRGSKLAQYDYWTSVSELRFPSAPSCLRHISSAIRVCRSFYYSIVHDIKFNSVSAMQCLKKLQLAKVRDIAAYFALQLDDVEDGQLVHVGVFVKMAGIFWKNSLVLEHHVDIIDVLHVLHTSSLMMLLPHLKEWVDRHAIVEEEDRDMGFCSNLMNGFGSRDVVQVTFACEEKGSRHLDDDMVKLDMFTIAGLYQGFTKLKLDMLFRDELDAAPSDEELLEVQMLSNDQCRRTYPILQLVDDAKPDAWWVFRWSHAEKWDWLLINFEDQIFWNRSMGNVICIWNGGEGMWNPKEWALAEAVDRQDRRRKTILEVLGETGVGVEDDNNRENEEVDDTGCDGDESDSSEPGSFDNDDGSEFEGGEDEEEEDEDEDEDENWDYDDEQNHRYWPSNSDLSDRLFVVFSKAFKQAI
jgi:hypothetical protein